MFSPNPLHTMTDNDPRMIADNQTAVNLRMEQRGRYGFRELRCDAR